MIGARWTPDEDAFLARENAAGVPFKVIAARLERTRTAVMQRCRVIGLDYRRRPWGAAEKRQLKAEIAAGVPYREIATRHGRTVNAIHIQACIGGLTRKKETTP